MSVDVNEALMNIMRITANLWEFNSVEEVIGYFCKELYNLEECIAVVVSDDSGEFYKAKENIFSCKYLDYRPRGVKIVYADECDCNTSHKVLLMYPYCRNGVIYIFTSSTDQGILAGLNYAAMILSRVLEEINVKDRFRKALDRLESNILHFQYLADRLRNPLSTIIGATEIRDEIPESKVFEMISESARRIWDVLDQLSDSEVKTQKIFENVSKEYENKDNLWESSLKQIKTEQSDRRERKRERKAIEKPVGKVNIKLPTLGLKIKSSGKVGLRKIPETLKGRILVTKWLEFLINKAGGAGVDEVLEYYAEIGWISEEAVRELKSYAEGLKFENNVKSKMEMKDHLISLMFIDMIRGAEKI